ncbi:hypothetical protein KIN20_028423 [Parelaphostrongylus tenuis]|uniref:Uncharacterized protein n=1 Tax=Parelaphostrongylus tenuis TaxID=148309 RepID=A0AAD5R126_PARTN|nr:hypothetical protein KIN20_028423 [Parelaphostrongylus tenuis]
MMQSNETIAEKIGGIVNQSTTPTSLHGFRPEEGANKPHPMSNHSIDCDDDSDLFMSSIGPMIPAVRWEVTTGRTDGGGDDDAVDCLLWD